MKLISLKIHQKSSQGWGTKELYFGERITQIYGPNESGKTPLVLLIMYCLGLPAEFRNDILNNCSAATLKLELTQKLSITRRLDRDFHITVEVDSGILSFVDELEFSQFLLEKTGIPTTRLTSKSGLPTHIYLSTLWPIFYLEQDKGYTSTYVTKNNFIQNQQGEIIRSLMGFPEINPYDKRKKLIEAQQKLKVLDELVHQKKQFISSLQGAEIKSYNDIKKLGMEIEQLSLEMESLKNSKHHKTDAINSLEILIQQANKEVSTTNNNYSETKAWLDGLAKIEHKIETEIDTLSLNEDARRVFSSFADICAQPGCGLFLASSETYGKNLLYLRDQLKDLESSRQRAQLQLLELERTQKANNQRLTNLTSHREKANDDSSIELFVETVSRVTSEMVDKRLEKSKLEKISLLEEELLKISIDRERAILNESALRGSREAGDPELLRFKMDFIKKIQKWLQILETRNVPKNFTLDSEFKLNFGTERFESFHGTSRLKIVLSYHAALYELVLEKKSTELNFLIFDTPKQHEISETAFDNFIKNLRQIVETQGGQVIFSSTSYKYEGRDGDIDWLPTYEEFEQPMFMGKPVQI
ncbi:hypothetical protein [Pseudomonas fluorescens]|uniref:Rad50/SbcC-type AAA domain-containing protein n=1 Tax=Pseudomonas fluorescens TaxID=294 RepID=A0A5E7B6V7_PSEFL|nr:hypothetical protein [Pseudomonas fluorescens]VVN84747.1 hypothetical protein PS691_01374 [Pseudomonas fluorescens]